MKLMKRFICIFMTNLSSDRSVQSVDKQNLHTIHYTRDDGCRICHPTDRSTNVKRHIQHTRDNFWLINLFANLWLPTDITVLVNF